MEPSILLSKDIFTLKESLKESMKDEDEKRELIIRAIPRKDRDAFCACFKDVREATPYEFAILREFAISQGYDFNEDADCNKYYYIFIVMDTPFG